jgi:F420-dependent oxidoreductase-like protein
MKIAMPLRYTGDPRAAADEARGLEAAGVGLVWVAELYSHDSVSILGYLAAKTERLQLMSGILPIYSRTPALIAMTAAGLDAVSGGRFNLGLGVSGPQVIEGWHGVAFDRPLGRTREIVDICRKVWRRERLEHPGPNYPLPLPADQGTGLGKPLKLINTPVRPEIPIYLASLGPKNVELTAEVASGWLPVFFHPEKAKDVWGDDLARGLAVRSADLGPLEIVAGAAFAICDEATATVIRDAARPQIALYVGGMGAKGKNFYNNIFRRYGYEGQADQIQELFLSGRKDEAAAAIPDEFLMATQLVGPDGHVRDRVEAYREAGVTWLQINPAGPDAPAQITRLAEWLA